MEKELRRMDDDERRRRCSSNQRCPTLFAKARALSEEFGAHVAVVAFSPAGEPHAFGGPTTGSVLRTYLPAAAPPSPSPGAETSGEAAARVARMRREAAVVWARMAVDAGKTRILRASALNQNWWVLDVEALREEELPVFVRALEMLRADIQGRLDAMASAPQPPGERRKQ